MEQKHIGIILLIIAFIIGGFVYSSYSREKEYILQFSEETGSCFLDDGTCLHEQNSRTHIFGWIATGIVFILGIYLTFFDKTQKVMKEHQIKLSRALASAKRAEKEKDEFSAFVAGFDDDTQKVLKAIKEQEGIKQSTLRFRTGLSKTAISLILGTLEKRSIISRKTSGKTKEVYLVKKF
ncbi:MAG: MarR family transcriptional regulator [Candidatus Woesearchaeota archaeon]